MALKQMDLVEIQSSATATASTTYGGWRSNSASNVLDGDPTTKWTAWPAPLGGLGGGYKNTTEWIELTWPSPVEVVTVSGLVSFRFGGEYVSGEWVGVVSGDQKHEIYGDGVLLGEWAQNTSNGTLLEYTFPSIQTMSVLRIETVLSPSAVAWCDIQVFAKKCTDDKVPDGDCKDHMTYVSTKETKPTFAAAGYTSCQQACKNDDAKWVASFMSSGGACACIDIEWDACTTKAVTGAVGGSVNCVQG